MFDAGVPRLTETELVTELRCRSRAGAEALYDRYAKALWLAIFRLVPEQDAAGELLCETYLAAWRTLESYDETEQTVLAWMMAIARKRALLHLQTKTLL